MPESTREKLGSPFVPLLSGGCHLSLEGETEAQRVLKRHHSRAEHPGICGALGTELSLRRSTRAPTSEGTCGETEAETRVLVSLGREEG